MSIEVILVLRYFRYDFSVELWLILKVCLVFVVPQDMVSQYLMVVKRQP